MAGSTDPDHYSIPRLYPGATVACVAGGASLRVEQIQQAIEAGAIILGINRAFLIAPRLDVLYACDPKWWFEFHPEAIDLVGPLLISSAPELRGKGNVRVVERTGDLGLELDPTGIRTGFNSGYQAINIAAHLVGPGGRIVLLGYDMHGGYWFGGYEGVHLDPSKYSRTFEPAFEHLVEPLVSLGVECLNATPGSRLRWFPKVDLSTALRGSRPTRPRRFRPIRRQRRTGARSMPTPTKTVSIKTSRTVQIPLELNPINGAPMKQAEYLGGREYHNVPLDRAERIVALQAGEILQPEKPARQRKRGKRA